MAALRYAAIMETAGRYSSGHMGRGRIHTHKQQRSHPRTTINTLPLVMEALFGLLHHRMAGYPLEKQMCRKMLKQY